jgi:hypothetical protein
VLLDQIMSAVLFSCEKASQAPVWLQEMRDIHTLETDTYGFWSFVYRATVPTVIVDRRSCSSLDACLLDDVEMAMGPAASARLPDPFPAWKPGGDS